ncbi:MAG: TIGR03792 family protein [Ilumatobacter sp.]
MSRDDLFAYTTDERLPVEVLVFDVAPEHVDAFLAVDHEVWTLGEAFMFAETDGEEHRIPFRSKEVWLDDAHPGRIWLVFVWDDVAGWHRIGTPENMERLQAEFDARFPHDVTLVRAYHDESNFGIHRVARFERRS